MKMSMGAALASNGSRQRPKWKKFIRASKLTELNSKRGIRPDPRKVYEILKGWTQAGCKQFVLTSLC